MRTESEDIRGFTCLCNWRHKAQPGLQHKQLTYDLSTESEYKPKKSIAGFILPLFVVLCTNRKSIYCPNAFFCDEIGLLG